MNGCYINVNILCKGFYIIGIRIVASCSSVNSLSALTAPVSIEIALMKSWIFTVFGSVNEIEDMKLTGLSKTSTNACLMAS